MAQLRIQIKCNNQQVISLSYLKMTFTDIFKLINITPQARQQQLIFVRSMKQLYPQQKQVLRKMRSGSMVEYFHQFYLKLGQLHDFHRLFDYKMIAYYLYENERKLIEQYYRDRCHQQTDENRRAYFEQLCAFLKQYNQEVSEYAYSQDEIEAKDKLFYERQSTREKAQKQRIEQEEAKSRNSFQVIVTGLWKSLCLTIKKGCFYAQTTEQQEKNAKQ